MIINNIQLYRITNSVQKKFKERAKHNNNQSREYIERKLSALIHNASKKDLDKNRFKYTFCGFKIFVNEKDKVIYNISWVNENHMGFRPSKELAQNLEHTNLVLGMDGSGNKLLASLDEIKKFL